jgi:tetratricopeptide (TPR) repeat protein
MTKWNDRDFEEWLKLRELYREAKKQKDYEKVIFFCEEIIDLDKKAKFIGIMIPLFYKDIANSYSKLENTLKAIEFYELAVNGFIEYRKKAKLNSTSDWLNDIEKINKKIENLKNKKE